MDERALRYACMNGHLEIVKLLLGSYPDINVHACDQGAFRFACSNGHLEVAKYLKSYYPEIDHKKHNILYDEYNEVCIYDTKILKWLEDDCPVEPPIYKRIKSAAS